MKSHGSWLKTFGSELAKWGASIVATLLIFALCMGLFHYAGGGTAYTATVKGFGGEITAVVTVDGDKIVDIKVTGDGETPELGGVAVKELPGKIVAAQSLDVDGVTGATISSTAIKEAVAEALKQAGLDISKFTGGTPAETEPADDPGDTPAAGAWKVDAADGTYSASAKGFGGDIVVEIVIEGGEITAVNITGDSETPSLGSVAVEKMPAQFMKKQIVEVDGISGATVSSTAIRTAFADALRQAGIDPDSLTGVADGGTVEKTAETLDVDVVIVGAGGAGMSAAITAKQAGKNVLLLEKMPYVGGNTTKASGGMNAAGTKMQEKAIAEATDPKVREALEGSTVENFMKDTMAGGHEINDPDLVRTMAEKSSDAIDWLESIGAPLPTIAATGGTVHMYLHEPEDGSAVGEYLVKSFSELLEKMEIPVLLDTAATELISENGKVVGVIAESEDKDYTIHARAVILATGGFGANEDMYCQYRPDLKGTVTTNAPGATGDGIVMAQALGADLVDIEQIQLHPTVFQDNGFLVSERLRSNGAILVNKNGERFTNDLSTRDAVSAAELQQPDCCAFIVYDSQYAEEKLYQKYVTNGLTVSGNTLEELAAAMGFDTAATENFVATVGEWNEVVSNGAADKFGRNNGLVALETGPYYAIKIAPGIHHTMGGVKIDTDTHVIDTNGNIIPGLFAAGEVTGGVHGGNRIGGNAVADIVVFGRIAGQNACAYADGQ